MCHDNIHVFWYNNIVSYHGQLTTYYQGVIPHSHHWEKWYGLNERDIALTNSLQTASKVCQYMEGLGGNFQWKIIICCIIAIVLSV